MNEKTYNVSDVAYALGEVLVEAAAENIFLMPGSDTAEDAILELDEDSPVERAGRNEAWIYIKAENGRRFRVIVQEER